MLLDLAKRAARRIVKGSIDKKDPTAVPERLAADASRIIEEIAKPVLDTLPQAPPSRFSRASELLRKFSKARLLLPLHVIDAARLRDRKQRRTAPQPTSIGIKMHDGGLYLYYNDGSLRRAHSKDRSISGRQRRILRKRAAAAKRYAELHTS